MAEPDDEDNSPETEDAGAAMAGQLSDSVLTALVKMCKDPKQFDKFKKQTEGISAQMPEPLVSAETQCVAYNAEALRRNDAKKTSR